MSITELPPAKRITFACCVEYGPLEEGAIRLVESLRRYGEAFAGARVIAVTPRRGPRLRASTLRRFEQLEVEYVRSVPRNRYSWMPYLNKYFVLKSAESRAQGDLLAWLDSDVLVLRPPEKLLLDDGLDLAACPRDKNIGTSGPGDEFEPYWQKVCSDVGLTTEDLPWVRTAADDQRVRLYWNAGIFVYRPASGFIDAWREVIEAILDRTDASNLDKLFWTDQVALGLAAVRMHAHTMNLPGASNYGIASHFRDHLSSEGLASARLLHYHDSMSEANWDWFLGELSQPLPYRSAWLAGKGPIREVNDPLRHLTRDGYRVARQLRRRVWSRSHGAGVLGR
ncbi:hypothetical protein GCM10027052_03100 [Parafrigoribacterium mesophilum]